jgi:glycosyltransferase involved in cell wall biosynthesis
MRIAFVSTRSDTIGGSNVHILDLAGALAAQGHHVVVLGGGAGPFADAVRGRGLEYRRLRHLVRPIRPRRDLAAVLELRSALRAVRPDLVSLHTAKAGMIGRLALAGSRVPVVYTPHGWAFTTGVPRRQARVYAALERAVAPLTTRFVDVCDFEREIALQHRVGRPERHVVVHNGMPDVEPCLRAAPDHQPARAVMVARFEAPKEQGLLLHALRGCLSMPWELQFVGDGPTEPQTRVLASQLGLSERVAFLGQRNDVSSVLAGAQVFVLASRWEGFPRSVLEGMRAGLPIVASAVGGVHEAVEHEVHGLLVPPGDAAGLTSALRRLFGDAALRARMGAEARRHYEERFTFTHMIDRALAVYQAVVAERSP